MLIDQINDCIEKKGFRNIGVNINGIYLHTLEVQQSIYIVIVLNCPTGNEFTSDQYDHIRNQIYNKFQNQTHGIINLLCIVCTNNVNQVRSLFHDNIDLWFIDTQRYQLILYENQRGDFLELRKDMEEILFPLQVNNLEKVETQPYQANEYKTGRSLKINKYFTKCNTIIIILNVLVFLFVDYYVARHNDYDLLGKGALYWFAVKYFHEYYRLFTYMFLHSGIEHIANNMIILLFLGDNLERAAGSLKYIIIYFASGIIAGITSLSYNMLTHRHITSVGASGAIFGVVGAMAYIVLVNKGRLENISTRQMVMFVFFSLYGGLTSPRIDNAAHIGGLIAGIVVAAIIYRKPKKTQVEGE